VTQLADFSLIKVDGEVFLRDVLFIVDAVGNAFDFAVGRADRVDDLARLLFVTPPDD
jgi:hypothetical protein